MATEEDVAAGLIDWINSLHVADTVYTPDDLSNGVVIWKALQQIDRLSFPGKLPEDPTTEQWIHKWTNLKHIYDALSIFLAEECGQRLPLATGRPDLKAIAQSSTLNDTVYLLKMLVVAAINCADRIEFLKQMQDLAESTQEVLMATAQEAGEDDREGSEDTSDRAQGLEEEPKPGPTGLDTDLVSEERLGKVIADNQRIAHEKRDLQKQLDEAYARYEKLQERHEQSQDELKEANNRLTAILSGKAEGSANRSLDSKHESLITALESKASAADAEIEELRKSNEVLKIRAEKAQKLQDDYDEIKIDRDRLARKANASEKYKQKLEATQDLEKDNLSLRTKINELQSQLKLSDTSRMSTSDLQRENDEYRRLLPSIEQERHELNEMKKRLELDYHALEARYLDSREELSRQQKAGEEMQGRLRDFEDGMAPQTPVSDHPRDLESEDAEFAESEARLTAALVNGDLDSESGISEEELKAIMAAMRAQAQAGSATERETSLKTQRKLLIAVEKGRSKTKQLLEHVQKQSEQIRSLSVRKEEPDAAFNAQKVMPATIEEATISAPRPQSPESETRLEEALRLNENLRRELKLMTSAWYEQNRRIASSSNVSYRARSGPDPRSFLGKQRKVVDSVILGGSAK